MDRLDYAGHFQFKREAEAWIERADDGWQEFPRNFAAVREGDKWLVVGDTRLPYDPVHSGDAGRRREIMALEAAMENAGE